MRQRSLWYKFLFDESGQGITEYSSILAFVAVLVVIVFGFGNGQLASGLSTSYSTIVSALNAIR